MAFCSYSSRQKKKVILIIELQTQIHLNIQTKVQFKISRIRNCSNPQNIRKRPNLDKKISQKKRLWETNKKGGKEKENNLQKLLPSFSFFRPLLSLLLTTIYVTNNTPTFQCSSRTLFKDKQFFLIETLIFLTRHLPLHRECQQEGCLLFSFLLFCWFLIIVCFGKFFWSKFGRFFIF